MPVNLTSLRYFRERLNLDEADEKLLTLLFSESVSESDISELFARVDVEALRQEQVSLLSQLCLAVGHAGVPPAQTPRMKGVSRYMTTRNTRQFASLFELARAYAERDIPVMLCKGAAMRLGYMTGKSRHMWDVDILVPPAQYELAVDIARKDGYLLQYSLHATEAVKVRDLPIDIHAFFHKTSVNQVDEGGIWERSRKLATRGLELYLPSVEDMLVQILSNEFYNLMVEGKTRPHLRWLYDTAWLARNAAPDWEAVYRIASEYRVEHMVKILLLLLEDVLPGSIDTAALDRAFPGYENNGRLLDYYRRICSSSSHYFRVKHNGSIFRYMWLWPRFAWHSHCFYRYGLGFWRRAALFPSYLKARFGAGSWLQLPGAALAQFRYRFRRDRGRPW